MLNPRHLLQLWKTAEDPQMLQIRHTLNHIFAFLHLTWCLTEFWFGITPKLLFEPKNAFWFTPADPSRVKSNITSEQPERRHRTCDIKWVLMLLMNSLNKCVFPHPFLLWSPKYFRNAWGLWSQALLARQQSPTRALFRKPGNLWILPFISYWPSITGGYEVYPAWHDPNHLKRRKKKP